MFEAHAMHAHILQELREMAAGCRPPDTRTPRRMQMRPKLDVFRAVVESWEGMYHNRPDQSEDL